jgi:hypothetical protein
MLVVTGTILSAQALPAPTNTNLRYLAYYGGSAQDVYPYTNMALIGANGTLQDWQTPFADALGTAASYGKPIMLFVSMAQDAQPPLAEVLAVAADYWDSVAIINFYDEVDWYDPPSMLESMISDLNDAIDSASLSRRPLMAQFGMAAALYGSAITASGLSIVGLTTAFSVNTLTVPQNVASFRTNLDIAKGRVADAGKQMILTMMAYNMYCGANCTNWDSNRPTLEAIQDATYGAAYASENDSNPVIGITMFSYDRFGGTSSHPNLMIRHKRISAAMGINSNMQPNTAVRGCSDYVERSAVWMASVSQCRDYCVAHNADSCEWDSGSYGCYVEYGDGCHLESGFSGWYAMVLNAGQMEQESGVNGCSSFSSLQLSAASPNQCMNLCATADADACEYEDSTGYCYAEWGVGCFIDNWSSWHATLLRPGYGAQ